MKTIEGQTFKSWKGPLLWPRILGDVTLRRCKFLSCSIGHRHSKDYSRRTVVRHVSLLDCEVQSKTMLGPAQFENVEVSNVLGSETFVLGALYRNVKLSGRLGSVILHGMPNLSTPAEDRAAYWQRCDAYYTDVDWALDISAAEFFYFEVRARAVPAHLIIRDPETQAIIPADSMHNARFGKIPLGPQVLAMIEKWRFGSQGDLLIVAPKRNKDVFAEVMRDISVLRAEGLAQAD